MGLAVSKEARQVSSAEQLIPFSIVIPNFNQRDLLSRCLASIARFAPEGTEVIVVDDASQDGSADMVREEWPSVRLIALRRNAGFCVAANVGWQSARNEVVELLNNDAEVKEGWARGALAEFQDPRVAAVAPLVRRLPFQRRVDSAGDGIDFVGVARKRWEGAPFHQVEKETREVFSASASSAFYRRSALTQVGGFPEHYGSYFDDVDLGYRLRLAGWKTVFAPASEVRHWVSQSHRHASRRTQARLSRNSERFFWTNLPLPELLLRSGPRLAYLLALLSYKGLKGEFGPWFAGKVSLLAELPLLFAQRRHAQQLGRLAAAPPPTFPHPA
jgi:GT2 family glycosyltransferase